MRDFSRKIVSLLLWLPFSIFAAIAVVISPLAVMFDNWDYAKALGRGMDRLGAAVMGWGGDYTISAECGSRRSGCAFCKLACRLLDLIQPGHCAGAAQKENINNNA